MRYCWLLLAALFCVVFFAGCGNGHMNTKGRIVKGGAPFTVSNDYFVRVTFIPVLEDKDAPNTTYVADYNNSEGTFKVIGPDLTGIPKGKYRVTISQEKKKSDVLKGAYDIEKTPFVFDIQSPSQEIVIDLDTPTKKQ